MSVVKKSLFSVLEKHSFGKFTQGIDLNLNNIFLQFAVDCARTHGFNFGGIVREAFQTLRVGQGEDDEYMIMTIIIISRWRRKWTN